MILHLSSCLPPQKTHAHLIPQLTYFFRSTCGFFWWRILLWCGDVSCQSSFLMEFPLSDVGLVKGSNMSWRISRGWATSSHYCWHRCKAENNIYSWNFLRNIAIDTHGLPDLYLGKVLGCQKVHENNKVLSFRSLAMDIREVEKYYFFWGRGYYLFLFHVSFSHSSRPFRLLMLRVLP